MSDILQLYQIQHWPLDLLSYLEDRRSILKDWVSPKTKNYDFQIILTKRYDELICGMRDILKKYFLRGYHCTRLTDEEVSTIIKHGFTLPTYDLLKLRIEMLVRQKIITSETADILLNENEAADEYRANMIWFCFFLPHLAGQDGIERFFRSWGGEALYNSHERNTVTGPILNGIGVPCIIEAKVPISLLYSDTLSIHLVKKFIYENISGQNDPNEFEWHIDSPLSSENILNIYKFPSEQFCQLTLCRSWDPLL